ncbi:ATP-binding protein [Runella sp. SP2]|uniref:ATP-binding protein n=1 Tax=Runella sp. SP2 TaxID=2268026 RepID=UPI000F08782C|nr:ATP-binding protein [Runella sp. SP2]AYQ36607.1 ATP-binding protein [Runella sp. SP2]
MIPRALTHKAQLLLTKFPMVSISGPRQSGKTTFSKLFAPDYQYVNVELLDNRALAQNDPRSFLERYQNRVILDEVQNVPDLFSYLQVFTDERNRTGEYVLTGSQNFLLMQKISQSLAGRVALLTLLPFSYFELPEKLPIDEFIFKGGYPRLIQNQISPNDFFPTYIQTYIERDVRQLIQVQNLSLFQNFLYLMAGRAGQVFNASSIANDLGINSQTVEAWTSVLEASYILFRLPPYYKNFNKRITKAPKVYFYDTGLLCYLLGIRSEADIQLHFAKGSIFENLVILEVMKMHYNQGHRPQLYYWRDSNQNEVDLLIQDGLKLHAVEIKAGKTINGEFFKGLTYFKKIVPDAQLHLVYGGDEYQKRSEATVLGMNHLEKLCPPS